MTARGASKCVVALALLVGALLIGANAFAANAHHVYNRPTLSFSPASFTVSYGTTTKLCVTATPARKAALFANASVWRNSVAGMFTITPGSDPACTGTGKVSITVLSRISDVCLAQGDVIGVLNNKSAGTAPGNILLPNQETASLQSDTSEPGIIDTTWRVTFSNSGASANFNGLPAKESTWIRSGDLNTCNMLTGADDPRINSEWTLANNSLIDANTRQEDTTTTCTSELSQVFDIGKCTVPPIGTPIKLTFKFINGTPTFTRSDAGGQ